MKLSRIINLRKYKTHRHRKIDLSAGGVLGEVTSELPPESGHPPVKSETQTVKDILESLRKSQQSADS